MSGESRPAKVPPPPEAVLPRRVNKPWGHEIIWAHAEQYVGKLIVIETGRRLSFQYHEAKDEWIHVLSGRLNLTLENDSGEIEDRELGPGDGAHVAINRRHRYAAIETCTLIEVSTPELDDVVRLQDDFGREGTNAPMTDFLAETTDLLRRTPDVVAALLTGIPDRWTATPDIDGGWRPKDVVGHLISAELDDWLVRTEHILEHGTAEPFPPFDRFAHVGRDEDLTLDQLIARFAALRAASLRDLDRLVGAGDLDRRGAHPALGEVTLRELLATWAVHDLDHVSQIYAGMAGAYDGDVGPWKAYLGILLRRDQAPAIPG